MSSFINISPFPYSFIFNVNFAWVLDPRDSAFQEVSGIKGTRNVTEIREGGENRFAHQVPEAGKYDNLVLKRGMMTRLSLLSLWVNECIESDFSSPIEPKDIWVTLMDKSFVPLMIWHFYNAYPISWSSSTLNAQENSITIETIEFAYQYFSPVQNLAAVLTLIDLPNL